MINDYLDNITYLENMGEEEIGYIFLLWMVGLGILLEVDKEELKKLAKVIERRKTEDALIDFLLKSCDIGWNHSTTNMKKRTHMKDSRDYKNSIARQRQGSGI